MHRVAYILGRPDSMSSPGGSRSYVYDALARIKDITSTHQNYHYEYDNVGNIETKTTGDGSYVYDYDDLYRLTDVTNPTLDDEAYSYDPVGNRLTASGVTGTIDHNPNNELELYGDISFDYDANGNTFSKTSASESWVYAYDVQNRLVRVEEDDLLIAEYGYDPFGRRLWKEVDGVSTYFLYSDEGLVAEYDESGAEIRSYGWQPDSTWGTDPLWLKEGGEYYWYQNDHLGTPQKLVDSTGTVVWSATYSAFGEASIEIELITNNLRFPGQYYDVETGLHYNWNRSYDPKTGRYTQTDPIGFDGGMNVFLYTHNNPANYFDPTGEEPNKSQATDPGKLIAYLNNISGPTARDTLKIVGEYKTLGGASPNHKRYIYTVHAGWIDLVHFFNVAKELDTLEGIERAGAWAVGGFALWDKTEEIECKQEAQGSSGTAWSYEDAPSNYWGWIFWKFYYDPSGDLSAQMEEFLDAKGGTAPENAPNWQQMWAKEQSYKQQFPQNKSFYPKFTQ